MSIEARDFFNKSSLFKKSCGDIQLFSAPPLIFPRENVKISLKDKRKLRGDKK